MNMGERPCTVRKYASTQVRKYASTLKTSAILVASLVGLWLGIIGQVSAATESEKVTIQPIPSAEDCGTGKDNVARRWSKIVWDVIKGKLSLDESKVRMNSLLTSLELINCVGSFWDDYNTIAHDLFVSLVAAHQESTETAVPSYEKEAALWFAKWMVSKGIDLTITRAGYPNPNAHDYGLGIADFLNSDKQDPIRAEIANQVAQILKPPPAAATKSCAEVDGQTPPANEYCIVAENLQSSIETEVSQSLKRLIGVDYIYKAEKYLSGTALYPGYKATITFTCASGIQDCGPAYVPGDRWSDNFLKLVKRTFGLSVKCSDSGNLLDVDSIEPGESVSVTHSSDTERSSPWYRNCEAISRGPFTLSIKTTRLAK